jgi:hypothetical protein
MRSTHGRSAETAGRARASIRQHSTRPDGLRWPAHGRRCSQLIFVPLRNDLERHSAIVRNAILNSEVESTPNILSHGF